MIRLRTTSLEDLLRARTSAVDGETRAATEAIVADVRARGDAALREHSRRWGDLDPRDGDESRLVLTRADLETATAEIGADELALLERTAARIRAFADAQRASLSEIRVPVPGGFAGHVIRPVPSAGCYAPGGRYPLPSSVLMTAVTARCAGVKRVIVASPRPAALLRAAAFVAGADELLVVGGAQAIAALAYGTESVAPVDFLCGPGNRWVTAAKQLVFGDVGVDMLAGPSELTVLADESADPALVAADLLAQAEHDPDARVRLVTTSADCVPAVEEALTAQLAQLPETSANCAAASLTEAQAVVVPDIDQAVRVCNRIAPEHLSLCVRDAARIAPALDAYGGLFVGSRAGEVLGDYGTGPNHVLPTGASARFRGGLSVLDFLSARTWLEIEEPDPDLLADCARLARLEGLEAHARSAQARASP